MRYLLWFAGCYNLLVGLSLVVFYHETFKTLNLFGEKPESMFFVQLFGILVGLFGVGYIVVARNPVENRNVLLLGLLSKGLGSVLGIGYVVLGKLPPAFLVLLFFADMIYLVPFGVILRRLQRAAAAGSR